MDIQQYINQNQDYLVKFKELGFHFKQYNVLGLTIVKYKHNTVFDDFNIKYKSIIINQKTNKIVSIAPMKSLKLDHNILYNNDREISQLHDGTMINVFYHNNEWVLSTRSFIGANNYWNKDSKKSFKDMFNECFNQYDELDTTHSYSFVLQHKDNNNISPIKENKVILIEEYSYENGYPNKINLNDRKSNTFNVNKLYNNYHELTNNETVEKYDKGFNIIMNGVRHVYITDDYKYIFDLKPNQNNKMFTFLTLYKQRKLNEYLNHFKDDKQIFESYKNKYEIMRNELYSNYCNHFIKKNIVTNDVPYQLKPIIYELHNIYKSTDQKINMRLINDYLNNMNVKRLTFILNYY